MMTARKATTGWTLQTLLGGIVHDVGGNDVELAGVCIDSREAKPGELFLSCVLDPVLANAHIRQAVRKGAVAVLTAARVW